MQTLSLQNANGKTAVQHWLDAPISTALRVSHVDKLNVTTIRAELDAVRVHERKEVRKVRLIYTQTLRETGDAKAAKKKADEVKKNEVAYVTPAGTFSRRANDALTAHSGIAMLDLDDLVDVEGTKARLAACPNVGAVFLSVRGTGLRVFVPVSPIPTNAAEHKAAYCATVPVIEAAGGITVDDNAGEDVARASFVTSDPAIHIKPDAVAVEWHPEPQLAQQPQPYAPEAAPAKELGTGCRVEEQQPQPCAPEDAPQRQPARDEARSTGTTPPELLKTRREYVTRNFRVLKWESDAKALVECPGAEIHTAGNSATDCAVWIDGTPSMACHHKSCIGAVEAAQKKLRDEASVIDLPLVPLMDISAGEPDPRATVLGNRFLCIGGAGIFVGPSGIGKSSASVQQDVLWSLGRPAFDIRPARPLRILTIQAENDGEDLAEMRDGVIKGLRLTDEDREQVRANVFYETECGRTGAEFLRYVDQRLAKMQFDLLRLDPLLAYLGADINDAQQTAAFLRNGLNPLLAKHRVACILNHHTPKVTNRDTSGWRASDWMYAGAGSADVTNWARAALVIDPTHAPHVFKFIAAKRGNRIGWITEDGEREIIRHFCHASDGLYWREATQDDTEAVEAAKDAKKRGKPTKTAADMKALVPPADAIPKNELLAKARSIGFTKQGAADALNELLAKEQLFAWQRKRSGTNPEVRISRHEQTLAEVPK